MPSTSADASVALAHPALLLYADEEEGLVIRPADGDATAARLRWGSTEPEEIATQTSSPQRGLQVDCLGGILSGFQGTCRTRSAQLASYGADLPAPQTLSSSRWSSLKSSPRCRNRDQMATPASARQRPSSPSRSVPSTALKLS